MRERVGARVVIQRVDRTRGRNAKHARRLVAPDVQIAFHIERQPVGPRPWQLGNVLAFAGRAVVLDRDAEHLVRERLGHTERPAVGRDGEAVGERDVAVAADGRSLFVAETFAHKVFRIPIEDDGSAGEREDVAELPGSWPDGLALDVEGDLYVGCYEPSRVLRVSPSGAVDTLYHDLSAHTLAHPTNLAFRGTTMFTSNLGRWHLTRLEVGIEGAAVPVGSA
jgi:hypothetical protein